MNMSQRVARTFIALKSKKILFNDLKEVADELGSEKFEQVTRQGLKHRQISNETYGRRSMVYVRWDDTQMRRDAEKLIKERGHKVNKDYWPGSVMSEIQVTYFKGHHWDE